MDAKAREIAQKIKENAFNRHGGFETDEAELIIAEALAEKDKEIARMREALKIIKRWRTTSVAESTIEAVIKAIEEGRG